MPQERGRGNQTDRKKEKLTNTETTKEGNVRVLRRTGERESDAVHFDITT